MRKRNYVIIAAAAVISMSLAACGNSTGNTSGSSKESEKLVYGTATLTYSEFYSGDVSSVDSFDAVSSATVSKYEIMPNMSTDFKDETTNANGYHILGVKNVNVAVPESKVDEYKALNSTFEVTSEEPQQYKTVSLENGKASYSATQFNIADTVTDAKAELVTGTNWGDYQINVTDGATTHLRNSREDEFDINSEIQGIILETSSGLKVGMEYLQSIWVQPYEVSFNVLDDNTHNTRISGYDNLAELSKLMGDTVVKITYIMQDKTYVYQFDGVYIKPIYKQSVTASADSNFSAITLSKSDFSDLGNAKITVYYTTGSGKQSVKTTLLETNLVNGTAEYKLDLSAMEGKEAGGVYSAVISSDKYADITVKGLSD